MASFFSLGSLRSRDVERELTFKRKGASLAKKSPGILGRLARYVGAAFGEIVNFFGLDFDQLWDMLVEGYFAIKTFDWNATDAELQKQIEANNNALLTSAADKIGEQLGFGIVRIANFFAWKSAQAAKGIKVPVLSAKVGLALAEEQNDEAANAVRQFLGQATTAMISNGFINSVLFLRRNELFGFDSITDENLPNGSIAEQIDEKIEKLPEQWRRPAEALIDGIEDGIVSAGYVVAMTIDDHVAAMQYAASDPGPTRTIEVTTKDGETFEMTGGQGHLMEGLPIVAAQAGMLDGKDVGTFFGDIPIDVKPLPSGQFLRIRFRPDSFKDSKKGRNTRRYSNLLIPNAKKGITRKELEALNYNHGPHRVSCYSSSGRQITVFASSKTEGQTLIRAAIKFSRDTLREETWKHYPQQRRGKGIRRKMTGYQGLFLDTKNAPPGEGFKELTRI